MKVTTVCVASLLVIPAMTQAPATVFTMLTGDYTTISNSDWSAYESGYRFDPVQDGSPTEPWISTAHFAGSYSIGMQVPTDNSGNKERFEYKIAKAADSFGLHFDNARYSGFAFKLGSASAPFTSSTLFWQAWQGSPWGPPASLKLTADSSSPYTIGLYIRNMTTGPDSSVSDTNLWRSQLIQPDTWYAVVIYLSPRYNSNGNIKLWINGTNYVDWTGEIGYDPNVVSNALDGLDIKNGIYQPNANNGHTMYFDQMMFADSYAEAAALPYSNSPPTAAAGTITAHKNAFVDLDLGTLVNDAETPSTQCLFSVSGATHGAITLLADGHTARFTPTTDFTGAASYTYTVTDRGEDSRELLHYGFEPPDTASDGFATDNSGHFRDGALHAIGTGSFTYTAIAPLPGGNATSLQLTQPDASNAACLSRFISPLEWNLSDGNWTFGGWFQRTSMTDRDFLFYIGTGDGFGGDGDELQLYCPDGSSTLRVQHYNTSNVLDADLTSSSGSAATGQWHHAALVFQRTNTNAGVLRAYLDGAQFGVTNVAWALKQQASVIFGGHSSTSSHIDRWFNGRLDDLVIFTNALGAAEVSRLVTHTVSQFGGLAASNTVSVMVTNYALPTMSNLSLSNGLWSMMVSGDVGPAYTVQTSTNLIDWSALFSTNPLTLPFRFTDFGSAVDNFRFYRVSIPQ